MADVKSIMNENYIVTEEFTIKYDDLIQVITKIVDLSKELIKKRNEVKKLVGYIIRKCIRNKNVLPKIKYFLGEIVKYGEKYINFRHKIHFRGAC